jgi:hypothetical protein
LSLESLKVSVVEGYLFVHKLNYFLIVGNKTILQTLRPSLLLSFHYCLLLVPEISAFSLQDFTGWKCSPSEPERI